MSFSRLLPCSRRHETVLWDQRSHAIHARSQSRRTTVSRYFLDSHASVLRLPRIVVADAGRSPLTLCGELAGRKEMLQQLLEIGLRSLSLTPTLIPGIEELIRSLRIAPATE